MPKAVPVESLDVLDVLRELVQLADKYPHLLQYVRLATIKEPRLPHLIEHARELVESIDARRAQRLALQADDELAPPVLCSRCGR